MRFLARAAALVLLTAAGSAAAEPVESVEPSVRRAQNASDAAAISARKLRHQWDLLRTSDPTRASCVEDKVARSVAIVNRIERRRQDLKEATDDKARAVALAAIDALDAQRVELEGEANVCVHGKPVVFPPSGTKVTVQVPKTLPADGAEKELVMLVLGLHALGK